MIIKEWLKQYLIKKQNKEYQSEVGNQSLSYDSWIRKLEENQAESIGKETESLDLFVWFFSQEGGLSKDADLLVADYFVKHPDCMILYGDEDVFVDGKRIHPWFKPDWSPDTFLSYNYLGNAVAIRKEFFQNCGYQINQVSNEYHKEILLDCIQKCGGFEQNCKSIHHLNHILFHGKKMECQTLYLEEQKKDFVIPIKDGFVSVIIPSKDNFSVLKQCILSVVQTTNLSQMEFVIVDNGSSKDTVEKIQEFKKELKDVSLEYIYTPMEFNFSKMCNLGASKAKGEYLLFLNDDTQAVNSGWIENMLSKASKSYVGAVGIKLLYPDGKHIQHAGVVNLPMGPVHKLQFLSDEIVHYYGWNKIIQNVIAVTAACLMIQKEKFELAGGFLEELKVAFNDVELCFRLYEKGYHNVVINSLFLYHHESLSRGSDESLEKWNRLMKERQNLYETHPSLKENDPYYSLLLNRNGLDTRILPGNEEICTTVKKVSVKSLLKQPKYSRVDECLLVRLERIENRRIQGYAVVLGSNNACYNRKLILKKVEKTEKKDSLNPSESIYGYELNLPNEFRPDLQENMKDQENVALCGFSIITKGDIIPGEYQIGVLAKSRISGQKILNFSNRILEIQGEKEKQRLD